jgi:hypothetical protein
MSSFTAKLEMPHRLKEKHLVGNKIANGSQIAFEFMKLSNGACERKTASIGERWKLDTY